MNTRTLINNNLPDVQSSADPRNIDIEYVGVKGIELPVTVESADGVQHTIAQIGMFVALPAEHKGTHMSRFLGLLKEHDRPLNKSNLISLMHDMLVSLESSAGRIDFTFPFFVKKQAPVSKLESLMNYQVHLCVEHKNTETWVTQTVTVPVTSLCPCSKEISAYGAHNQRSHVTIAANLKRVDEKFVTESAYENPKFVEDLVRDVAVALNQDNNVQAYCVQAENFESIHNHSAYAQITRGDL